MLGIAKFAMRGVLPAATTASGLMLISILALVTLGAFGSFVSLLAVLASSAVVALVILHIGVNAGIKCCLIGMAILGGIAFAIGIPVGQMLILVLTVWIPIGAAATVLRSTVSLSYAMLISCGVVLFGVVVTFQVLHDPSAVWYDKLNGMMDSMLTVLEQSGAPPPDIEQIADYRKFVAVMARVMTGAVAATSLWMAILGLMLARSWQARLYNPGGFQSEFHGLRLGQGAAVAGMAICGAALVFGTSLLTSLATVVIATFLFQGLAVVHALVKSKGMSKGWLVGVYAMLLLIQTSILLGALGMADNWLNLRKT